MNPGKSSKTRGQSGYQLRCKENMTSGEGTAVMKMVIERITLRLSKGRPFCPGNEPGIFVKETNKFWSLEVRTKNLEE